MKLSEGIGCGDQYLLRMNSQALDEHDFVLWPEEQYGEGEFTSEEKYKTDQLVVDPWLISPVKSDGDQAAKDNSASEWRKEISRASIGEEVLR